MLDAALAANRLAQLFEVFLVPEDEIEGYWNLGLFDDAEEEVVRIEVEREMEEEGEAWIGRIGGVFEDAEEEEELQLGRIGGVFNDAREIEQEEIWRGMRRMFGDAVEERKGKEKKKQGRDARFNVDDPRPELDNESEDSEQEETWRGMSRMFGDAVEEIEEERGEEWMPGSLFDDPFPVIAHDDEAPLPPTPSSPLLKLLCMTKLMYINLPQLAVVAATAAFLNSASYTLV